MESYLHLQQIILLLMIIEILSDSTAETDRGLKKEIDQDIFCTPNYLWFEPTSLEFKGFQLIAGQYEEIAPSEQGWLWSQQLGLYLGIQNQQLRFFTSEGKLILSPEEIVLKISQKLQDLGLDWRDID